MESIEKIYYDIIQNENKLNNLFCTIKINNYIFNKIKVVATSSDIKKRINGC